MTIGDQTAEAVALYDQFVLASTCQSILSTFQQLCDCLDIHPLDDGWFYQSLKAKLTHWKAVSLWNKLDKRFNHKEYSNHKACTNTRVLVIGAGPCGLRSAIECKLLGARVVVVEKRDRFSRNNVLHLWPFVIHDLKSLGAKVFYPKFCAGSIDHISIRQLQCVLMKISLILGVEVYANVGYEDLLEPSPISGDAEQKGWRAKVTPEDHPVSCYDFDVLIGADGKRNTLQGFSRKEFRGKLAIAITANFINHQTTDEARVEEISGVAFIFNQKFFKDLTAQTGIDLENIVYYKDDTHYFVMTAKKNSLLEKGVLLKDCKDTVKLLSRDNVNQQALQDYAREAADVSTNYKLPKLDFAHNHFGQPDIAMFDFTSLFAAENSCRAMERYGRKLLINIVGDSLLEPFWPTGSGCARGFLGCFDAAWAVRSWASGSVSPLQVLAERESVYMLLSQTTPESLSKSFNSYTINPITRYKHCNTQALKCIQVRQLYDTTETINIEDLEPVELPTRRTRTYDILMDHNRLLRWCRKKLSLLPAQLRCDVADLTTSWQDGRLFCLLVHLYSPEVLPVDQMDELSSCERLTNAFNAAESLWGILPMLTPEEITSGGEPDKLFMISYISQFYTTLRDKRPMAVAPEFLEPPSGKHKMAVSPSGAKISTLRRLGKIIGTGSKGGRRRKSSSGQKSPRDRRNSRDGPKSPHHLHSPGSSTQKSPSHRSKLEVPSTSHGPSSPKHGKLSAGALDIFKTTEKKEEKKALKAPGTEGVKSRMKEIRDAFSLKNKKQKTIQPPPKKKAVNDEWVAGKYEKLEAYDQKFKELSHRMEPGNLGNTNPGKRGSNLVSEFTSMFEKSTPESSPVPQRKSRLMEVDGGLEAVLNREPKPNEICFFCKKRIYLVERQSAEGVFFHRSCFRCHHCDVSLHVGSYTLHRTPLGQARFYCEQHVGKEALPSARHSADLTDSRSTSMVFDNEKELTRKFATPERIEFENSIDLSEESEELQNQHNLSALSPTSKQEVHWHSESEDSDDMDEDGTGDALPSINDVLDEATWRRNQKLHKQIPSGSESTLDSLTLSMSSSAESQTQNGGEKRSVSPSRLSLNSSSNFTTSSRPKATTAGPAQPPVSILKQPININTSANQKPAQSVSGSSRAAAWSQQQSSALPASQSPAISEINKRRSNFFSQATEPVRLDAKAVLDPHPSSTPAPNLSAVNISLGDTLLFKKDKRKGSIHDETDTPIHNQPVLSNEGRDNKRVANEKEVGQEFPDITTSEDLSLSQQNVIADTLTLRSKTHAKADNQGRQHPAGDSDSDHDYDNVSSLVAAGVSISADFVTKRKPKTPVTIPLFIDTEVAEQYYSDSDTISTPSDNEIENMSPVGTLTSDAGRSLGALASVGTSNGEGHTPSRRKIPIDESLHHFSFDHTSSEEEPDELQEIAKGVVRHSGVELDGSFQKMCLTDELPLASEEELSDESDELYEDSDSGEERPTGPEANKMSPEKIQNAAARQHKRDEMKRLRMAQEIQRQLQEVEVKTKTLETEGVQLEKSLRKHGDPSTEFDGGKNKELMQRWFNVIHNKSQLFRYESELMVRAKELELEDRHARLTNQLRLMMLKPESEKSHEEAAEEKKVLEELIEVVQQRDELVNLLETERLKERREDEELQNVMTQKGFELSPVPYTQVTLKKGYKGRQSRRLLSQ